MPPHSLHIQPEEMNVCRWWWSVRTSRAKQINMLCVEYDNGDLMGDTITEFITILHDGYARYRAEFILRTIIDGCGADITGLDGASDTYLENIAEVLNNAKAPDKIKIKKDGKYYRVLERYWGSNVGSDNSIGTFGAV